MFVRFLRENVYASYLLTILRLYLGWVWFEAGFKKISAGFDVSGFLRGAVEKAVGEHPAVQPWWADFINGFALPNAPLFNFLVPWGEFLVGLGLILGTFTTFAVWMGALMNFSYLFSGTTSTNPEMVLMEIIILVAGFNGAKIGIDRWLIPLLRKKFTRKKSILRNAAEV
ncbi:DoxX family protein [Brevibacillus sp. NRS-1366]|uniref:DoxX family protein n=1 Tax=Brevibacillus sp. NRS-1366 TaxID=3233899 RepID=UPI003D25BDB4